jgi:hypothetical protein
VLTGKRGWSQRHYARWLEQTVKAILLEQLCARPARTARALISPSEQ